MKKRILCGLLAVLLLVQSVPLQTYAAESLPETILEENDASAMDEMDSETEKGDSVTDEVLPTETPETVEETVLPIETEEPTEVPELSETPETDAEEIPTSEPECETTEEPTVMPEEEGDLSEIEEVETPEAEATITPEEILLPTESPTVTPSAVPDEITEEFPEEIEIDAEMTAEEDVPALTLDEVYSVSIENGGESKWMKFTATQAGEYFFYNTDNTYNITSGLYADMADAEPVAAGAPVSYSSGWYAVYTMEANETVYWKMGYVSTSKTGTINIKIKKKLTEINGTFTEPAVTAIPYGFEVELNFTSDELDSLVHTNGVNDAFMTLVYSADPNADFDALSDWIQIKYDDNNVKPEGIKTIRFEQKDEEDTESGNTATFFASTVDDTELLPDTTYYYAIFSNIEKNNGRDAYYWKKIKTGTAVTGVGVEASKVTFDEKKCSVEAGYAKMYMEATIQNPDNEVIVESGFKLQAKNTEDIKCVSASVYDGKFYRRESYEDADAYDITPYVKVREGNGTDLKEICGTTRTLTRKDASQLKDIFTIEPTYKGAKIVYDFAADNKADDYFYITAEYGKSNEELKETNNFSISSSYQKPGFFSGNRDLSDEMLEQNTEYKVVLTLSDKYYTYSDRKVLYTYETTFTPKTIVTYTETDFPDEAFRALIQNKIGEGKELNSYNLGEITRISVYEMDDLSEIGISQSIKSIEGIQYLENLESLTLRYNDISDISKLTTLKYLGSISLDYNEIKTIPDFSNSSELYSLSLTGNLIPESEFVKEKFHANYLEHSSYNSSFYDKNYQRSESEIKLSDFYYKDVNETVTFFAEVTGTKGYRDMSVTLKMNNKEYDVTYFGEGGYYGSAYNQYCLDIADLPCGTYEATVVAQEDFGGRTITVSKEIEIKEPEVIYARQKYIDNIDDSISVNVFIPYTAADEKVNSIKLVDQNNKVVGVSKYEVSLSDEVELQDLYKGIFSNNYYNDYEINNCFWECYEFCYLGSFGLSGAYDLIIETTEKTYRIEDYATTDYAEPIATYVSYSSNYDNAGDYYYLTVQGEGLNYDKFYPVLLTKDGSDATEYVSWIDGEYSSDGAVFKLKKLEGFVDNSEMAVKLVSRSGYPEIKCQTKTVYTSTNNDIIHLVYNGKTDQYLLYASSEIPVGTEITLGLSNDYPDYDYDEETYDYEMLYATAKTVISENKIVVDFRDTAGEFYEYVYGKNYYYGAEWEITEKDDDISKEYDSGHVTYNNSGFDVYYSSTTDTSVYYSGERYQTVGSTIVAEFTASDTATYAVGDTAVLCLEKYDDVSSKYVTLASLDTVAVQDDKTQKIMYCGTFTDEADYTVGRYRVTLTDKNGVSATGTVYIYENGKIYQLSQSNVTSYSTSKLNLHVSLISSKTLDKSKFSFEFYDINKTKLTNWKLSSASKNNSSESEYNYWNFTFNNLPGEYRYLYAKVLYDGKVIADIDNPSTSYYKASGYTDEYGISFSIYSNVMFSYATGVGFHAISSSNITDYTVEIYADEYADFITSFKVPSVGTYEFTKELLKDVLAVDPELNNLYTLIAKKNGLILASERYVNIGYTEVQTPTVAVTDIKLNKSSTTLKPADTLQLTATITPNNATNKTVTWSSADQLVATVDTNGLVTAVGVGKTVITATTSNGKTATCTVTVYQSEGGEITLKPGDTYQLTVPEGISASDAVYQSDNTSVATVSSKGLVTAVGTGNAIITFKSGSVTITYSVIVSNPLESISFEEAEVTLEVDETVTNGILLKPVNTDTEIAFVVTVGDENVAEAALLNGLVQIKGKAAGTTKVTVSNGELKAECEVTVLDKMTIPDTSEHMVYALTNKDKTLADISDQLLSGFTFKNPEIKLSPFAGVSQKDFAVIYTDENGRTSQSVQKVNLLTINGINPVLDSKTVKADGSNQAVLSVEVLWKGYDADDSIKAKMLEKYHFEVTPDKAGIVNITEENGNYIITGAKTGKVKINVLYRENGAQGNTGILYQKKLDMAVVSKMADIQLEVLGAEYHAEGDYYYVTDIKAAVSLKAVAEGYKLTWKASDTGIAKIGKAKGGVSAVTLKNNGKVKLTVTANDSGKTAKSIILYVMDAKPSVDGSVTVNKASEVGGTLGIYGSYGYDIEKYDVQLLQKADVTRKEERFSIRYNEEKDVYEVNVTDRSAVTAGKYPVTVKITAQTETGEKEYLENVTITVTDKVAAYNVKQSKKVNLFYADATENGKLSLTSKKAVVESVTLSDCDFSYDYQTGEIQFTGKDYKTADKNGILSIKLKGYHEIKKNITINTEVKKPGVSVSASSSTVYPNVGIVKAQLQLTNKNTKETLAVEAKNITQPNLLKDAYQVYAEDGQLMLKLKDGVTAPKTAKIKVSVKMDGWNESVSFTHTVKSSTTKTVKLQLSGSKVTINKNDAVSRYQQAEVKVRAQGATESDRIQTVSVNGADKKSIQAMNEGLKFNFDGETGILTVTISNGQALTKTTYSFNVRAEISEGKYATAKLKVTIVDKAPESLLSVTCKGSIDVFDRENSYVTCTPKVKNLSGKITGVSLTGRDAHLFEAEMNESGKTIIKAKEGVAYITKYAYKAQPVYEISSGDRTYTVAAKTISLKLKQTKPNLTTSLSSQYLYQASDNKLNVSVMALNSKGKGLNVRNMELVETKAIKDAFELIYDEQADSYQLTVKDVSKVKKGKSYKLKLNVYLNEQADNEKAYPVTVTVTVK